MNKIRNPLRRGVADTLREAVLNHAYRTNTNNSVIDGIRHVSDLWLLARRHQSLDNIMREVTTREDDPDISRITIDLQRSPEQITGTRVSERQYALDPEVDWMMI